MLRKMNVVVFRRMFTVNILGGKSLKCPNLANMNLGFKVAY